MDIFVWFGIIMGGIFFLLFIIPFLISMLKKDQCSGCKNKFRGKDLTDCSEDGCEKEYCKNCEKINIKECKNCENQYCTEHFAEHDCGDEDEDDEDEDEEDEDDDYTQSTSSDGKVICGDISNLNKKQCANKISEIIGNGFELKAGDGDHIIFVKKDVK